MDIILASASPRRRELLASVPIDFRVMSVDVDETPYNDETPTAYIKRMVSTKADAAVQQMVKDITGDKYQAESLSSSFVIITADTIGVLPDGKTVLIKPTDREHAYSMWQQMSDDTHEVWTAVQVTQVSQASFMPMTLQSRETIENSPSLLQVVKRKQIIERTAVTFIALTSEMMSRYWHSGEPADKAGGYAIQGLAAAWVMSITGSYTNVVGLPLAQTLVLIQEVSKAGHSNIS